MRIIAFIEEEDIIRKILEHVELWEKPEPRPPPSVPGPVDIQYLPFSIRNSRQTPGQGSGAPANAVNRL